MNPNPKPYTVDLAVTVAAGREVGITLRRRPRREGRLRVKGLGFGASLICFGPLEGDVDNLAVWIIGVGFSGVYHSTVL